MFRAIVIEKDEAGYRAGVKEVDEGLLSEGDVTVRVRYSTLNYKDGLAITGRSPVVRRFPMIAGIDFAGIVESSRHSCWKPGDAVVLNGWGVGETHTGGLAQRARVDGNWLVPLPAGLDARQAMAIGTAGYTAMLCVMALERHGVAPGSGDILVTGASGGVGSVAVALLSRLGHRVVGRRGRYRRQPHAGQRLREHPLWRRGRGLRARAGHGFPGQRRAFHPARHHAVRHRQRDGPGRTPPGGLDAPGARPRPRETRGPDADHPAGRRLAGRG